MVIGVLRKILDQGESQLARAASDSDVDHAELWMEQRLRMRNKMQTEYESNTRGALVDAWQAVPSSYTSRGRLTYIWHCLFRP
jgi:hypothetical protein